MKMACLAWGSLVWDPRSLPVAGPFRLDGPALPIEFSRVSFDGRVTLVIDHGAPLQKTLWVPLDVEFLDQAIEELGRRERIAESHWSDWIGRHSRGDPTPDLENFSGLEDWLEEHSLDAVVWTALPCRTPEGDLEVPSLCALLAHLESLSGASRGHAEQYVRRTPDSVRTPHRAIFESVLGWVPSEGGASSGRTGHGSGRSDAEYVE